MPPPSLVYAAASDFEPDGALQTAGGPRPVHVLKRGDIEQPIEPAVPGALACLAELPARFELEQPKHEGARRAALAHWLTDPRNPLTWRSIVNRVWHYHFGRGLVDYAERLRPHGRGAIASGTARLARGLVPR